MAMPSFRQAFGYAAKLGMVVGLCTFAAPVLAATGFAAPVVYATGTTAVGTAGGLGAGVTAVGSNIWASVSHAFMGAVNVGHAAATQVGLAAAGGAMPFPIATM